MHLTLCASVVDFQCGLDEALHFGPMEEHIRLQQMLESLYDKRLSRGALAQLVERINGIDEVNGSTPLRSISLRIRPLIKSPHLFKDRLHRSYNLLASR